MHRHDHDIDPQADGPLRTCPRCGETATMLYEDDTDAVCGNCHFDTTKSQGPPPGYYDEPTTDGSTRARADDD